MLSSAMLQENLESKFMLSESSETMITDGSTNGDPFFDVMHIILLCITFAKLFKLLIRDEEPRPVGSKIQ